MAITNVSDLKIYDEQLQAGYIEQMAQFTDAFNAASNGTIVVTSQEKLGNYEKEAFFKDISSSIITRQDITSNAAVAPTKLLQDENIRVKLHRRFGAATTYKSFNMIGENASEEFSFLLGQSIAKAQPAEMLNTGIAAAKAAIGGNANMLNNVTAGSGKVTHTNLIGTMRKFGDAYNTLGAWIMHSSAFFDLSLDAVANQVDSIVADILRVYTVPTLGVPVIVTDSPALLDTAATPDHLFVLGLTQNSIQLIESENSNIIAQPKLGNAQLELEIQGEYAYNLGVKGYKWDVTNGGVNPDATAVTTATNWDKVATFDKHTAGVMLQAVVA